MTRGWRIGLAALATLLLAGGATWAWHRWMTKEVVAVHDWSLTSQQPYLPAIRLLERHGHPARTVRQLDDLGRQLPAGTLLMAGSTLGVQESAAVLDWVRRGNTLIVKPGYAPRDVRKAGRTAVVTDGIGSRYGVVLGGRMRQDETCRLAPRQPMAQANLPPVHLVCATPPGHAYPLELAHPFELLNPSDSARPLWGDTYGLTVLVFAEGRGRVVLVAGNYFDAAQLRYHDHGELLLALAGLAGPRAPVTIVKWSVPPTWTDVLWRDFTPALLTAMLLVLLWVWSGLRRFGPQVPDPAGERRALLEHVDASGRWLWSVPGGRELLLGAVRGAVAARLRRRAPELEALPRDERVRQLAARAGLPAADVDRALHGAPGRRPADFAHQISTLQRLRAHHER